MTTRNKLRGPHVFPLMVRAWLRVRRQLARTPGMLRYVTGVSGLTEFYTLTVWERRAAMFDFTASGAHRQMMWMFSRWSESFWSMRWRPTAEEYGQWAQAGLGADPEPPEPEHVQADSHWLVRSQVAEALAPYIDTAGRPDPRTLDPRACGVEAVLARVATRSPGQVLRLMRGARPVAGAAGLLRFALGIGPGECLLVSLWKRDAAEASEALMRFVAGRFADGWAMRLSPGDYEIGHWNGLRMRQLAARQPHSA